MKAEGVELSSHPCLEQMLVIQGVLERTRPLDTKLKHTLERLISLVSSDPLLGRATEGSLRPRLGNMITARSESRAGDGDGVDGGGDGSSDEEDGHEGAADSRGRGSGGVYQAPKTTAVPFEENPRQAAKEERRLERMRSRMMQSELLLSVRSEVLGSPEEVAGGTSGVASLGEEARAKVMAEDKEKEEWEMEHMIRRQVTKKERKRRKSLLTQSSSIETIGNVGDAAMIWSDGARAPRVNGKSKRQAPAS